MAISHKEADNIDIIVLIGDCCKEKARGFIVISDDTDVFFTAASLSCSEAAFLSDHGVTSKVCNCNNDCSNSRRYQKHGDVSLDAASHWTDV